MDAIELEVTVHALAGITEEMMARLIRAAYSSNIKERRDCSTALFDAQGRNIAQAAAIPVHLGALAAAVAAVRSMGPAAGEIWLLNDPFAGGSHLPDWTLVTVVAHPERPGDILGFAVSRAHHSDVGGMRPGSMPAASTEIFQEGLILPPVRIGTEDGLEAHLLRLILANVRQPEQRLGDLRAQVAAGALGAVRLVQLAVERGDEKLMAAIDAVIAYTERRLRSRIAQIPDGTYRAVDFLEGPEAEIRLELTATVSGEKLRLDFSGTADQVTGNLNAPIAVTRSAVAFALRALLDPELPTNDGALAPVELIVPAGSLLAAQPPAAVVAGNVETSQRIADLVMLALADAAGPGLAQGQGTMNNLILGNAHFSYYETIGGGQGASSRGNGLDGVHVGMSNTLNTPIEALELEFPLTVRRYELREHSGGGGIHRGGLGIVRELVVGEPCTLSLLSDRRRHAPHGAAGGGDGMVGENFLNGEPIPAKTSRPLRPGDRIRVETPGGGGWGVATSRP